MSVDEAHRVGRNDTIDAAVAGAGIGRGEEDGVLPDALAAGRGEGVLPDASTLRLRREGERSHKRVNRVVQPILSNGMIQYKRGIFPQMEQSHLGLFGTIHPTKRLDGLVS